MVIGVNLLNQLHIMIPILHGALGKQIIFVRKRPPQVAERRQPGNQVLEIAIIDLSRHTVKAPGAGIIRVEDDQIGFDAAPLQVENAFFKMLKITGVKAAEIPIIGRFNGAEDLHHRWVPRLGDLAGERIAGGFIHIERVAPGENAHAHLVKWRLIKCS